MTSLRAMSRRQIAHPTGKLVHLDAIALYVGFNQVHLTEQLGEVEGIALSRSSVRRILGVAGIGSPRTRRAPQHRSHRPRYPQAGMLVQIDASPHDWLEGRGPRLTLFAAIDDATGALLALLFRADKDAQGYFLLVRMIVMTHGRPTALYHDRHGIFQINAKREMTLAEQLAGAPEPTQFGRLLDELAITSIAARSPRAKGRVERLFGTLQDRLTSMLRLAEATNEAEATACLPAFLSDFNDRFTVPAAEEGECYRAMEAGRKLDTLFCFTYQRTVGMDNTVRFGGARLHLLPGARRRSWARAVVEVRSDWMAAWRCTITEHVWRRQMHRWKRRSGGRARAGRAPACPAPGSAGRTHRWGETGDESSVETGLSTATGQNR